ncbi:MAG: 1-acyl-sn-glycerol-3-phosphate acyltransferase [Proteobacteria bacterium]|nr:1-acyl-sn-glycerol-3-phosphate acyltransferase [Pseudomonadota bacterium]
MTPHIDAASPAFPGDSTPQPPFNFGDSLRSLAHWPVGIGLFAAAVATVRVAAKFTDLHRIDSLLKIYSRIIPKAIGVKVKVEGADLLDLSKSYVYVLNHVNIFDMLVIYQAIPQYTRAFEHIDHFSWPIIGPFLQVVGQIPVYPKDKRKTVKSLRMAAELLAQGESFTVLPEGERTLDGSLGPFHLGAFNLAIKAGVSVVPMAIRGGRAVSRRGDWRFRPGVEEVLVGAPVSTKGLTTSGAIGLAKECRQIIIDLLHGRRAPGA